MVEYKHSQSTSQEYILTRQMLIFYLILFAISLGILIKSAGWMSDAAIQIAHHFGLPSPVIGATIITLVTTIPETLTSIISGVRGHGELGIGNAFGSPATNVGLIMGLTLLLSKPKTKPYEITQNIVVVTIILSILGILFYDQVIGARVGILLIIAGITFLIFSGFTAYKHAHLREHIIAKIEQKKHKLKGKELHHILAEFLPSVILLPLASFGVTESGVFLAKAFQIPEFLIGFTMIAIGTALPELAIAITLFLKKRQELSFGNLTGSSILTLTLSLGTAIIFHPFYISPQLVLLSFPFLIVIFLSTLLLHRRNIPLQFIGGLLLILYVLYVINNIFIESLPHTL